MTPRQALGKLVPRERPTLEPGEQRIQKMLTPLVEALTHAVESCREAAVEHVLKNCLPAVVERLIDRLVELLGSRKDAVRRQAVASLVQFGGRALPALTLTFNRTRSAVLQQQIAEVLTRIARGLQPDGRSSLTLDLMILLGFAADDSVREVLGEVAAVIRQADERASQASRHRDAASSSGRGEAAGTLRPDWNTPPTEGGRPAE